MLQLERKFTPMSFSEVLSRRTETPSCWFLLVKTEFIIWANKSSTIFWACGKHVVHLPQAAVTQEHRQLKEPSSSSHPWSQDVWVDLSCEACWEENICKQNIRVCVEWTRFILCAQLPREKPLKSALHISTLQLVLLPQKLTAIWRSRTWHIPSCVHAFLCKSNSEGQKRSEWHFGYPILSWNHRFVHGVEQ